MSQEIKSMKSLNVISIHQLQIYMLKILKLNKMSLAKLRLFMDSRIINRKQRGQFQVIKCMCIYVFT